MYALICKQAQLLHQQLLLPAADAEGATADASPTAEAAASSEADAAPVAAPAAG